MPSQKPAVIISGHVHVLLLQDMPLKRACDASWEWAGFVTPELLQPGSLAQSGHAARNTLLKNL